ncbi:MULTISPECIES: ATP-binding protein [Flavobacterium]|uniref:ATP-binding protein n=1 Tax=Flavobacterium TaxID=237 RepID=UPI000745B9CC|nr:MULTISPECIES: ATP-binding protein [Flavobacterium]AMA50544.1 ATPase [Flavobacterium covae]MCJ1810399.1 ATP-binding protein [Flavobacterium covae]
MNYIKRAVFDDFNNYLHPNKVLILLGARRVGKTQLIKKYVEVTDEKVLQLNGEDKNDARLLEERTFENYKRLLRNINLLVIDEAQAIEEIGLILKFIVDTIDGIKVIATGSSMFDLNNKLGEPLVGRKNTLYLYPLSQIEFSEYENYKETVENLEMRLIYGGYPELTHYESWYDKQKYLREIINSYLLKDILVFDGIKNSNKIYDLLRLIAFQIGKEVSLQELGKQLQLSKNTVERYLDLLTKVFIVFRVDGFSRNLRKEITKSSRWYFFDNGIRNAIIGNFNTLQNRMDIGDLWENYLVSERLKKQIYHKLYKQNYFWRTYDQQELDWLEESADNLAGYEFKWNENKKTKIPTAFAKAYPDATFEIVNKKNYLDFIL